MLKHYKDPKTSTDTRTPLTNLLGGTTTTCTCLKGMIFGFKQASLKSWCTIHCLAHLLLRDLERHITCVEANPGFQLCFWMITYHYPDIEMPQATRGAAESDTSNLLKDLMMELYNNLLLGVYSVCPLNLDIV
ncbi:hypothetical protein QVD17_28568 [Tagetes erecta]|uniref:Uncharacterized protein n=1 Tax=Tagetes erecta TaxID=13708 RepID=A0AAD8NSV2_TARER|nr:hypothetical protein QVD17_28568 [Tagetes erecta]